MPDIELLPLDQPALHALHDAPETFAHHHAVDLGDYASVVQDVAARTAELGTGSQMPWGGYLAVDRATRTVIGTCAFKGAPAADGTIEIAYFTFPAFEGRGYASAMAGALLAISATSPAVRHVVAHTLPEPNASGRILAKLGFERLGEVYDPDDGPVWRWRRQPPAG